MKNNKILLVLLPLTIIIASAIVYLTESVNASAPKLIKWCGCGITKKAFMGELAEEYRGKTGSPIMIIGGGATKGIRFTNSGRADMGGNCRPSLPDEFPNQESDVELYVVAWDALVPIVHKTNPINSISTQQLQDILTGKITNWNEVGGKDMLINVLAREGKISGVGYMTRKIIFSGKDVDYTPKAILMKSSGPLENKISYDPYAIGVTGVSSAKKRIASGKNLKILMVDGIEASKNNIGAGLYPFFRPLYLTANPTTENYHQVTEFINWTLSQEGQQIIDSVGTVNLLGGRKLTAKFSHWENTKKIANYTSLP